MEEAEARRLRQALKQVLPAVAFDDEIVAHIVSELEGDRAPSEARLFDVCYPFFMSAGACDEEEDGHAVCGRLETALGAAAAAAPAAAAAAAPPRVAAAAEAGPPASPAPHGDPIAEELREWLERLKLAQYAGQAEAWCRREGAAHLNEVLEEWESFADFCELKKMERKRVEKDVIARRDVAEAEAVEHDVLEPSVATPTSSGPCFGPSDDPRRYALLEELGSGATATVYRCTKGDSAYAVKTINLGKLKLQRDYQRYADKLHREVSILLLLRHPRIVSLYDVIEDADKLYMVMELVEGGELFDYIVEQGSFSEATARHVFLQIAEGLQYIHSKDIVYRDLKPENILVDRLASKDGMLEIKLSDFGHSKLINDGYSTALTRVGTPQYWAPEVSDPAKACLGYDQTVDLWSMGVVLYVMLIGAYPFDGMGERIESQIQKAQLHFRRPGVSCEEPSSESQDLIRALIKVRPQERLSLERCRMHAWVTSAGDSTKRLMKLHSVADSNSSEERIQLPVQPTKQAVEALRRDLQRWEAKFKCSATVKHMDVIAHLGNAEREGRDTVQDARSELLAILQHHFPTTLAACSAATACRPGAPALPTVQEASQCEEGSVKARVRSFRLLNHTLRVDPEHGAGLELIPEKYGMRIEQIFAPPGQPGLQDGDLITKINEVSLRGTADTVERIFRAHFQDGVQLAIKRERRD